MSTNVKNQGQLSLQMEIFCYKNQNNGYLFLSGSDSRLSIGRDINMGPLMQLADRHRSKELKTSHKDIT